MVFLPSLDKSGILKSVGQSESRNFFFFLPPCLDCVVRFFRDFGKQKRNIDGHCSSFFFLFSLFFPLQREKQTFLMAEEIERGVDTGRWRAGRRHVPFFSFPVWNGIGGAELPSLGWLERPDLQHDFRISVSSFPSFFFFSRRDVLAAFWERRIVLGPGRAVDDNGLVESNLSLFFSLGLRST